MLRSVYKTRLLCLLLLSIYCVPIVSSESRATSRIFMTRDDNSICKISLFNASECEEVVGKLPPEDELTFGRIDSGRIDMRYSTLVFDIFLYVLLILASVILLVGLALYNQWFLIPWMVLMFVDIIRGIVSTVMIFVLSHGNLARIATGIFFLGLQFFHISILLIIIAKFQRIHNRKKGLVVDGVDKQYDPRVYGVPAPPASIPSNYNGYSPSSQLHRNGSAAPPPPIMAGNQAVYGQPPYSDYSPSSHNVPPPQQRGYYEPRY